MSATTASPRPASPSPIREAADDGGLNLVVLRGWVSSPPELRSFPSGSRLVTLALRVPAGDGTRTSVPVAVWDPAPWVEDVAPDDELIVTGTVRRRFFRSGAATGARVEVQAVAVGRAGDGRRRAALARRARRELGALD